MYRIVGWNDHFENSKSRTVKETTWVPIPNKQDGDGYTDLLDHPDGAAHYGAWMAIVLVASRCHLRGTLCRDGGRPHTPSSLARMTRVPEAVLVAAIERLVNDVRWLEVVPEPEPDKVVTEPLHLAGTKCPPGVTETPIEGNGMEGNGKEEEEGAADAASVRIKAEDVPLPASLDTAEVRSVLAEWFVQRRANRLSLREPYLLGQYRRLEALGPVNAVACLRHTIDNDYDGIFPEKFGVSHGNRTSCRPRTSKRFSGAA